MSARVWSDAPGVFRSSVTPPIANNSGAWLWEQRADGWHLIRQARRFRIGVRRAACTCRVGARVPFCLRHGPFKSEAILVVSDRLAEFPDRVFGIDELAAAFDLIAASTGGDR